MNPQQWFIKEGGREIGPLTPSELRDLVRAGRITSNTPVRPAQRTAYVAADTVSGLLPPAPAPLPEPPGELFEANHPRHDISPLPDTVQLDTAAKAEDLFESHAPRPRAVAKPAAADAHASVPMASLRSPDPQDSARRPFGSA